MIIPRNLFHLGLGLDLDLDFMRIGIWVRILLKCLKSSKEYRE